MVHLLQQVVIWCSRLSNLGDVAIPLHNKKNYVQTKITDFFKRAPMGGKRVKKVQQKLTKYFGMKPKKARPGATAPRHHRRRHRTHHIIIPCRCSVELDHISTIHAAWAAALFPAWRDRPALDHADHSWPHADRQRPGPRALQVSVPASRGGAIVGWARQSARRAWRIIDETLAPSCPAEL